MDFLTGGITSGTSFGSMPNFNPFGSSSNKPSF